MFELAWGMEIELSSPYPFLVFLISCYIDDSGLCLESFVVKENSIYDCQSV